jgi:hypothetical protein
MQTIEKANEEARERIDRVVKNLEDEVFKAMVFKIAHFIAMIMSFKVDFISKGSELKWNPIQLLLEDACLQFHHIIRECNLETMARSTQLTARFQKQLEDMVLN